MLLICPTSRAKEDVAFVNKELLKYLQPSGSQQRSHFTTANFPLIALLLAEHPLTGLRIDYDKKKEKGASHYKAWDFYSPVLMQLQDNNPLSLSTNLLNPEMADCIPIKALHVTVMDPPTVHERLHQCFPVR